MHEGRWNSRREPKSDRWEGRQCIHGGVKATHKIKDQKEEGGALGWQIRLLGYTLLGDVAVTLSVGVIGSTRCFSFEIQIRFGSKCRLDISARSSGILLNRDRGKQVVMTFQTPKANGIAASYLLADMVMQIALNVLDSSWGVSTTSSIISEPSPMCWKLHCRWGTIRQGERTEK